MNNSFPFSTREIGERSISESGSRLMLDGGANINVIAGHSKHIVHNPERLRRNQTFLGILGKQASENSSFKLNDTGLICLLGS